MSKDLFLEMNIRDTGIRYKYKMPYMAYSREKFDQPQYLLMGKIMELKHCYGS